MNSPTWKGPHPNLPGQTCAQIELILIIPARACGWMDPHGEGTYERWAGNWIGANDHFVRFASGGEGTVQDAGAAGLDGLAGRGGGAGERCAAGPPRR